MRLRKGPALAVVSLAVLPVGRPAAAQPVRAGADFQVNTYTTGSQRAIRAAGLPGGGFVAVWHSDGQDGSSYSVHGQRYDGSGAPVGAEFQANTYTTGRQYGPLVSADARGNFVVVWQSDGQDGSLYSVVAQRYDAAGNRRGGEFLVNTHTTGYQVATDAAHDGSGNFLVVWTGTDQDGDLAGVYGQRFDPSGAPLGAEFQIHSATTGNQLGPRLGMAPGGDFVVSWTAPDGDLYGVSAQRFAASGARVGGELRVNTYTTGQQHPSQVAMADSGAFVVTWRESDGSGNGGFGRRYDSAGNPLGGRFQLNAHTTGSQNVFDLAMDPLGNFTVSWLGGPGGELAARRFLGDATPREPDFVVSTYTTGFQSTSAVVSDAVGNLVVLWTDTSRDGSGDGVFAQRFGGLLPSALAVDAPGNGVLQPNEAAEVRPSWTNRNGAALAFGGTLAFTGPAGPTYGVADGTAGYGSVANGATAACTDCYAVEVLATSRPALHWDATATETITPESNGQRKAWSVHVGDSFDDVPAANGFYRFVETLLHRGVTTGCGPASYCPATPTTRGQMAVFVLVAREGPAYVPPACATPVFADVPASSGLCRWVEELARRGVVGGCGGGNYCPDAPVTREQMAVFVLRTLDPAISPPACAPPNLYGDVPESSGFCRWIEELTTRGIVSGCGGGNYCPAAAVTREQMGVFLGVTFGLSLYGP
jgi:hypothetical protein